LIILIYTKRGWIKDVGRYGRRDCHEWYAEKKKRKGRVIGGFSIKKKREWDVHGCKLISREEGGMVMTELKLKGETWKIVSVYETQRGKNLQERLDVFIGAENVENIIIGGDFNIGIGELKGKETEEGDTERCSKNKAIGKWGKRSVGLTNRKDGNGRTEEDWEGEFTYVGSRGRFGD